MATKTAKPTGEALTAGASAGQGGAVIPGGAAGGALNDLADGLGNMAAEMQAGITGPIQLYELTGKVRTWSTDLLGHAEQLRRFAQGSWTAAQGGAVTPGGGAIRPGER